MSKKVNQLLSELSWEEFAEFTDALLDKHSADLREANKFVKMDNVIFGFCKGSNEPDMKFRTEWVKLNEIDKELLKKALEFQSVNEQLNEIKVSCKLEELCDRIIAIKKDGTHRTILRKTFEDEDRDKPYYMCSLKCESGWIENCKQWLEEYDLYFAIFTDKGLTYVAKMNEQGECEQI